MWREHNDTSSHGIERGVYYTAKGSVVYAFSMAWPKANKLQLMVPNPTAHVTATMLGTDMPMKWEAGAAAGSGIVVTVPPMDVTELPSLTGPWVFKLMGVV